MRRFEGYGVTLPVDGGLTSANLGFRAQLQ